MERGYYTPYKRRFLRSASCLQLYLPNNTKISFRWKGTHICWLNQRHALYWYTSFILAELLPRPLTVQYTDANPTRGWKGEICAMQMTYEIRNRASTFRTEDTLVLILGILIGLSFSRNPRTMTLMTCEYLSILLFFPFVQRQNLHRIDGSPKYINFYSTSKTEQHTRIMCVYEEEEGGGSIQYVESKTKQAFLNFFRVAHRKPIPHNTFSRMYTVENTYVGAV